MTLEEAIQNFKKWLACINRDDLDCLRVCDSCQNHVEAVTLYESLTVIVADADKKTDEDKQLIKWLKELAERRKLPEIVKCKDCENWDTTWQNDSAPNYHYCPMMDGTYSGDFYCAKAERRTDANNNLHV